MNEPKVVADEFDAIVGVRVPREDKPLPRRRLSRARRRALKTGFAWFLAATVVFGGYNLLVTHSAEGECWRFGNYDCFNLSPEFITRTTGIKLPAGTEVLDSWTSAWLSWSLDATVLLPPGEALSPRHHPAHAGFTFAGCSQGRLIYKISAVEDGGGAWLTP